MAFIGDYSNGYVCRFPIHHYGGGFRPPPQQWGAATLVESIMVEGKAANVAIQVIPDESHLQ